MPRDLGILALLALAEACGGSGGTAGGVGDARYVASDSGEGGFQPGEGFVPLGNADASAPDAPPRPSLRQTRCPPTPQSSPT